MSLHLNRVNEAVEHEISRVIRRFDSTNAIAHGNDLIELLDGIAEAEV
jgi:hypothetical protein